LCNHTLLLFLFYAVVNFVPNVLASIHNIPSEWQQYIHMPPYIYSLKVTTIHTHSYNFWRTKTIHIHYSVICEPSVLI
jgi:hypothetical protein